jgi:aflatoxin B1 aldehyde reductase
MAASDRQSDSLRGDSHVGRVYRDRYFKDKYFQALALIRPVVEAKSLTMTETAIRWLVHHQHCV